MKYHFLIPKIPFALRVVLFIAFELGGLYYQLYLSEESLHYLLSIGIMLCGTIFLIARNYKNKPKDLGFEDWQPVTRNEFNRIKENLLKTKEMSYPFYYQKGLGVVLIVIISIVIFIAIMIDQFILIPFAIDAGIILSPLFISGLINLWTPSDLKLKIPCFDAVIKKVQPTYKKLILTPYLRFDKDSEGKQIPEDVRFMIEPRRKPDDFIGVQFQAAINNGPNGAVPYMYAVFLCKGKGDSFNNIKNENFGYFLKEPGGDNEYGYVVLRQRTGGGGYHTTDRNCIQLYETAKNILLKVF
jgi:hypothetical protein